MLNQAPEFLADDGLSNLFMRNVEWFEDMMVKKMVEYDIELLNEEEAKQVPNVNQQVLKISK